MAKLERLVISKEDILSGLGYFLIVILVSFLLLVSYALYRTFFSNKEDEEKEEILEKKDSKSKD
ncbi:hypothetical protein Mgra_00001374 [Meloidogyne graminicola]|uniref:Uncharacterized protein n=1 Tax=Meloidogyne graminicola TaxID=189291 RepID=A0A8T0A1F9_9BILA|nr:hypothetical protein Mgra_00001374 [Meloidogyne graminicola]